MPSTPSVNSPRGRASYVLATHEFAPFRGGVATYVHEIARGAREAGLTVEIWTADPRGRRAGGTANADHPESSLPFPVVRLSSSGRLTPGGLLRLAWGFHRRRGELAGRPVILLSVGAQMVFFVLGALGVVSAARVTCFFHGSEVLRFRRNPFWRVLARRFYARAAGFAVNSFHVEHLLRTSGLLPSGAEIVLAPCAGPAVFREAESAAGAAAHGSDGSWRVLTVARLHPRKGQWEVARALAMLPPAQRERVIYQMVGVGEASYRDEIDAACRAGGVRCEWLGALEDRELSRVYAAATVYVQASRTLPQSVEGFGISFLEASFHGCPVAAFRSGGVDEAVRDGETGLLVPEGDLPALAAAVGRLLGDDALRARMGAAGREFARGFSWEESARILCGAAGSVRRSSDH